LSQSKDFYEEFRIRVFRPPPSIPMESPTTIVADNLQINAVYTFGHKNPADVEGGYFVFVRVPASGSDRPSDPPGPPSAVVLRFLN